LGSMAIDMTGIGNAICSRTIGAFSSQRVSPVAAVRRPTAAAMLPQEPAADERSIAVLPFANLSEDKANEYFADGLSDELLNLLSRVAGLRVVARTSSFSFKGRTASAAEIARELKVTHLLEGSVRRSGSRVRITAQLIRASDSSHVWSQSFDRDLSDIFAVQDEIAAAVARGLELKLFGGPAPKAQPTDPRAYALYLQGRHFFSLYSATGYAQAIPALEAERHQPACELIDPAPELLVRPPHPLLHRYQRLAFRPSRNRPVQHRADRVLDKRKVRRAGDVAGCVAHARSANGRSCTP